MLLSFLYFFDILRKDITNLYIKEKIIEMEICFM